MDCFVLGSLYCYLWRQKVIQATNWAPYINSFFVSIKPSKSNTKVDFDLPIFFLDSFLDIDNKTL